MNSPKRFALGLVLATALAMVLAYPSDAASVKHKLIGTWELVSLTRTADGNVTQPLGSNPMGYVTFDQTGHFSAQVMRSDIPRFAINSKNSGTDAENRAVIQGMLTEFGTFTLDDKNHVLIEHIVGCNFPNWDGTDVRLSFDLKGDRLTFQNPAGPSGALAMTVFKRIK